MGKYFGTDGFRGEANKVLTADHAYKIGRYLGWYYNQNHRGRIIIGKDTRRSSYMFEYALVAGITASGADAFLLHVTTTPSVAYVVRDLSGQRVFDALGVLGGEQTGHIIFSKHATTGDGILTSLMLMEVIMETKQSLGQLTEEVKIYPQLLKNVRVADKKTARENPEVVKAVDAVAEALGDDGRILVRESGTEPVIRVMVEAATDELCEKYVTQVIDVIEKEGLIVE